MELKLDRLSKHYGPTIAVDRVDALFTPGVYGLLGANGSGKTTLMRMICGVLKPTSGQIDYDGRSIATLGEDYRNVLGYLPQDFGYYPEFTALDFMCYLAALKGLERKHARTRSLELLDLVGLEEVAKRKIKTFSGGMKQRLGIAQAVINEPKVLIFDEPTAGLDPKERVRFRNLISSFSQDKIVILSTHIVSDVEYIADTILLMKAGSFVLSGTSEDLVAHMEGKVWECSVEQEDAARMTLDFCVSNLQHAPGGRIVLRVISDVRPMPDAVPMAGTLEDLYLYHFQDEPAVGSAASAASDYAAIMKGGDRV